MIQVAGKRVAWREGMSVADLLDDAPARQSLADAAVERVHAFDGHVVAAQYVQAYHDAIEMHGLRS